MDKKKTRKSKAATSVRNLPQKTLNAKTAQGVKGGFVAVEHGASGKEGPAQFFTVTMQQAFVTRVN